MATADRELSPAARSLSRSDLPCVCGLDQLDERGTPTPRLAGHRVLKELDWQIAAEPLDRREEDGPLGFEGHRVRIPEIRDGFERTQNEASVGLDELPVLRMVPEDLLQVHEPALEEAEGPAANGKPRPDRSTIGAICVGTHRSRLIRQSLEPKPSVRGDGAMLVRSGRSHALETSVCRDGRAGIEEVR